jgi:hypothetical protein
MNSSPPDSLKCYERIFGKRHEDGNCVARWGCKAIALPAGRQLGNRVSTEAKTLVRGEEVS